jgi:hypothetical protein
MSINAISKALPKKAPVSACCAPSPVCEIVTSSAVLLKSEMAVSNLAFTSVGVYPPNTFEYNVITLFALFRLMLP